jgi:hypothetical protein
MHVLCSALPFVPFCFLLCSSSFSHDFQSHRSVFIAFYYCYSLTYSNDDFFLFSYFFYEKNCKHEKQKSGIVWSCLLWQLIWMEGTFTVWMRYKAFLRLLRYRTLSYLTRFYIPLLLFRAIFLLIPLLCLLYFSCAVVGVLWYLFR